mmetsp:Transcript_15043/g.32828  ORF Transcript_15043/g.32828 Transcript_15043/m.32828 type:complete len:2681 (+) Transcript_15043:162-8204(+)
MEPPQQKAGSPTSVTSRSRKGGFSLLSKAKSGTSSTNGGGGLRLNPFGRSNKKQGANGQPSTVPPPIRSVSFNERNKNKQDVDSAGGNTDGNNTDNSRVSSLTDRDGLNAMAAAAMAAARKSNVAPRSGSVASSEASSDISLNKGPPPPLLTQKRVTPQMLPRNGSALRGTNSNVGTIPQLSRSGSLSPTKNQRPDVTVAPSNASSNRAVASRVLPVPPPPPPASKRSSPTAAGRREPPVAGENENAIADENQQKKIPFDKVKALLDRVAPPSGRPAAPPGAPVLKDSTRQAINGRTMRTIDEVTPRHSNVRDPSPVNNARDPSPVAAAAAAAAGLYIASSTNTTGHRKPLEPGRMPMPPRQEPKPGSLKYRPPTPPRASNKKAQTQNKSERFFGDDDSRADSAVSLNGRGLRSDPPTSPPPATRAAVDPPEDTEEPELSPTSVVDDTEDTTAAAADHDDMKDGEEEAIKTKEDEDDEKGERLSFTFDGEEKNNAVGALVEKANPTSPIEAVALVVGDISRQIQQSLGAVVDLEEVDRCLSPTVDEVRPTVSTAETNVVSNVAAKNVSVAAEAEGSKIAAVDASPRGRSMETGRRRSRSLVVKGKGSIRDVVLRQSGASKSVDPKSRFRPVATKKVASKKVDSSKVTEPTDDFAEIMNEGKSSNRRRKKSKTILDVRASVNKKASAMAKKHAAQKEFHGEQTRESAKETSTKETTKEVPAPVEVEPLKNYPDEISLSKYEIISDLDQQSLKNSPKRTAKRRERKKKQESGPRQSLQTPASHVPELTKSLSSASSAVGDRYMPLESTPKTLENSIADDHSMTESKKETGELADQIAEWSVPDNNFDAEGVEMVVKPRERDLNDGEKDSSGDSLAARPPVSCAAACLSTFALDDDNATATKELTIDVPGTGAGQIQDEQDEQQDNEDKDEVETFYGQPSMGERDIQTQRSVDYMKQKLREKLRMHSLARNLSASSSQESQEDESKKDSSVSTAKTGRSLKVVTDDVNESDESTGSTSIKKKKAKREKRRKKKNARKAEAESTPSSSSFDTKSVPVDDSSISRLDPSIEEAKTGTSSQWTDIRTEGDQSSTVSGSSKVKIMTKDGEKTILLTESVREKLRARASASKGNSSDPIMLESLDSEESKSKDGNKEDLIDLTEYGSFEDLGIADEAVWLFDVSPKNSVDQELWQPRSTDMDSVMDFGAARLQNGGSDKYDLAEPGKEDDTSPKSPQEGDSSPQDKAQEEGQEPSDVVKSALDFASKLVQSATSWADPTPNDEVAKNNEQSDSKVAQENRGEKDQPKIPLAVGEPTPVVVVVQGTDVGPVVSAPVVTVDGILPATEEQASKGKEASEDVASPKLSTETENKEEEDDEPSTQTRQSKSQDSKSESDRSDGPMSPPAPEKMFIRSARPSGNLGGRMRPSPEQPPPMVFHQRGFQMDGPIPVIEKKPIGQAESYGEDPVQSRNFPGSELGFYSSDTPSATESFSNDKDKEEETKAFVLPTRNRPSGYVSPVSDAHFAADLELQLSSSEGMLGNPKSPAESAVSGLRGFHALANSFGAGDIDGIQQLALDSIGSQGPRLESMGSEGLQSPVTVEGLNLPQSPNTMENTFSGSAFLDIEEPDGISDLDIYKPSYAGGVLASSGMAAAGLLSGHAAASCGELIPGSFHHPALEGTKSTRKPSTHLTADHPVTKRDLLDVIFEGAEALLCGAQPDPLKALSAAPEDVFNQQQIIDVEAQPNQLEAISSTPKDGFSGQHVINVDLLPQKETDAIDVVTTRSPASVGHEPQAQPQLPNTVPNHELARAHLAFPDDIPGVVEETAPSQARVPELEGETTGTDTSKQAKEEQTDPNELQTQTQTQTPAADAEVGPKTDLSASSLHMKKETHVLETIDGAIEKEKQRYQAQGLVVESEQERLARVFGEEEEEDLSPSNNPEKSADENQLNQPVVDDKEQNMEKASTSSVEISGEEAGKDCTEVICIESNEEPINNAIAVKESKPIDPEADNTAGDASTAATTLESEEKTLPEAENATQPTNGQIAPNPDVDNILSNPHFAAALETYCLANNLPNPIASVATSPSGKNRDPPSAHEEGESSSMVADSNGAKNSALDPPLIDAMETPSREDQPPLGSTPSSEEQGAQQASLIEATEEGVEVMVEADAGDEDDLRSLEGAPKNSLLEDSFLATSGSGSELEITESKSAQSTEQEHVEAASAQSTKQEQTESVTVQNSTVIPNAGEVIVAIENGLQQLCTYPLDHMFPPKKQGNQNQLPSSIHFHSGNSTVDNSSTAAGDGPPQNHADDASLAMSASDVDPAHGVIMTSHSKSKTVNSDGSNLLFALTRSDDEVSRASSSARRTDISSEESEREKQRLLSRVERVRALLDGNAQRIEDRSLPSSVESVPGAIMVGSKNTRSPQRQSVLERLRKRRDASARDHSLARAAKSGHVDPNDLFTRYDSIVKQMVVSDTERLGLAQERQLGGVIDMTTSKSNHDEFLEQNYGSLLDDGSASVPSIRSHLSNPSEKSSNTTPSDKARDLRKQLDQALKTSAAIRDTQELLNTEMSTFKTKLQRQRNAALTEVEALTANISPRASGSPTRARRQEANNSPRSPVRAQDLEFLRASRASGPEAGVDDYLNDAEFTSGSETGGSDTGGSETDEDDVRLQHLDSIIHGLRDAQQRRQLSEQQRK